MRYRRAYLKGATYFFTVNLADRSQRILVDHVDLLRKAFSQVQRKHPFHIDAIVILPDHLHAIWTLPDHDDDFSTRWRLIKGNFSRELPALPYETPRESQNSKKERSIWQRRFWEHLIRNDKDYARHVDYIHFNPVKHEYVKNPIAWKYSSLHRFVAVGTLPKSWGTQEFIEPMDGFGER